MTVDQAWVVENHGKFTALFSPEYHGGTRIFQCDKINERTPWLNYVVGQIKGVKVIIMVKSDSRQ